MPNRPAPVCENARAARPTQRPGVSISHAIMLLFRFALLERRISHVGPAASTEGSRGRRLEGRMERLELSDQVSQAARRLFGTGPGRAVTEGSRLGLARETQRLVQVFTNAGELLELYRPDALGAPCCVERAADPDQIAEGFERDSSVALCQPSGVEAPPPRGVKVSSQALEGAMISSASKLARLSREVRARRTRFCGCCRRECRASVSSAI